MGLEAQGVCRWKGQVAPVKALLESRELILRGDIRARILREDIRAFSVDCDDLIVETGSDILVLHIGSVAAARWAAALSRPLPTLAQKLGVSLSRLAYAIGTSDYPELSEALAGFETPRVTDAAMLVAIIHDQVDLDFVLRASQAVPQCPIWCIYGKGKHATLSDAAIRSQMRGCGYVDNKTSAVSERLTATRYARRAPPC